MKQFVLAMLVLICVLSVRQVVFGQTDPQLPAETAVSYSVAVYPPNATDPQGTVYAAQPVVYLLSQVQCGLTKRDLVPVANPTRMLARFDDPADATKDCEVNISSQVGTLTMGSYRISVRANGLSASGPWSEFSESFNRVPVAPHAVTRVRVFPSSP